VPKVCFVALAVLIFPLNFAFVILEKYFPEYTAGPDINKAKYILWLFIQANRARLSVYRSKRLLPSRITEPVLRYSPRLCSLTQVTDTTNFRLVIAVTEEAILQNALKDWYPVSCAVGGCHFFSACESLVF